MIRHPEAQHGIVSRMTEHMYGYQGWPTVCRDETGKLFAVASSYRMGHVCPFGKIAMYTSEDEGETWSAPMIVADTLLDDRDPGLVPLGDGRMLLSWFTHPPRMYIDTYGRDLKALDVRELPIAIGQIQAAEAVPAEKLPVGSFVQTIAANGRPLGGRVRVPVHAPHGPARLSDGTLIYVGTRHELQNTEPVTVCRSRDDGASWEKIAEIGVPEGFYAENFVEPHVLELKNGRLLGCMRAMCTARKEFPRRHTLFTFFSDDAGESWSMPQCIEAGGSPPHLLLHSSGAVICSYGRRENIEGAKDYGQRALVSYDNGETFREDHLLRDDGWTPDLGYPSTVELSDGSLLTVYYQRYGQDRKASILYTKWKLHPEG